MQSSRVGTIVERWQIEGPLFCPRRCASYSAVFSTSSQHKRMLLGSFCSLPGVLRSRLEILHRFHSQGHDIIELLGSYHGIPRLSAGSRNSSISFGLKTLKFCRWIEGGVYYKRTSQCPM